MVIMASCLGTCHIFDFFSRSIGPITTNLSTNHPFQEGKMIVKFTKMNRYVKCSSTEAIGPFQSNFFGIGELSTNKWHFDTIKNILNLMAIFLQLEQLTAASSRRGSRKFFSGGGGGCNLCHFVDWFCLTYNCVQIWKYLIFSGGPPLPPHDPPLDPRMILLCFPGNKSF